MSAPGNEARRKALHIAMGAPALLLRWLTPVEAALCAGAGVLFNRFLLPRLTGRSLERVGERSDRFGSGIVLYPAAVLGLVLVFHRRPDLAAAAWGLLAFGDGLATVVGRSLGGPRLPWNPRKTWSGLAAFVAAGTAAAALLRAWVRPGDAGWEAIFFGGLAAALVAGVVESLRSGLDDNLSVPLAGGAVLYAATLVEPTRLASLADRLVAEGLPGLGLNAVVALLAWVAGSVNRSGAVTGCLLGSAVFALAGWPGWALLLLFFVLGSAATRAGFSKKRSLGIAQEQGGRRGARHAIANTAAATAFAFLAAASGRHELFLLAFAAAIATAASDTVASEIGQAFGRRTVLVTSFREVPPGTAGAVSVAGTVAGVAASGAVATLAWGTGAVSATGGVIVVIAALAGTTFESYVGAAFERTCAIDNGVMNFANTVVGGCVAIGLRAVAGGSG